MESDNTRYSKRNSSVEIFRIIATILVLIVHFNGWLAGGVPQDFDFENVSNFRIGQLIIQALSCICVNCFIIISGFYGLNLRFKSLWNLFILLLGIYVPLFIITSIYENNFALHNFINSFFVFSADNYFVQCYLMLIFLSPIINSYVEREKEKILYYSIAFVLIEWWMECIREQKFYGFNDGYSVLHFLLIYILARTAYIYKSIILKIKIHYWIIGYFLCTATICGMYICNIKYAFNYTNPVVIASSFCAFFPFLYKNFYSFWINWIAASTFSVFIIHTYGPICHNLGEFNIKVLNDYSYGSYLLIIGMTIITVFIICILYDKVIGLFTKPISEVLISIFKRNNTLNRLL